ncbi:MAG: DUF1573 domain-containing protein [Rikenellaceae bacterium]
MFCLLNLISTPGQNIAFDRDEWNFGEIAEDGGKVSHIFTLYNKGQEPVVIIQTQSSCGCTTSEYPQRPIMPGDSVKIRVDYDPMNRPYQFTSTVRMLTSSSPEPLTLSIKGDVTPRIKSIEERYPLEMGRGLRLSLNYVPLSYIEHNLSKGSSIGYINNSNKEIKLELKAKKGNSQLLNINYPKRIAPSQSAEITFNYLIDGDSGIYGAVMDSFDLYIDGRLSRYPITILGHVTEQFTQESKESAPRATLANRTLRGGNIKRSQGRVHLETIIENTGISELIFRKVTVDSGLECSVKSGDRVAPGESQDIYITIDPSRFDYDLFTKYITFTTNDPEQPMQRIRVNGVVEN